MKKKIIIDILIFILMILEFSRMYMPTIFHELIGIILLLLVIIHLLLNKNYIKSIPKGKYNTNRIVLLLINILFFISFSLSTLFGILSSQDLLRFMNIGNINIIKLHKTLSYISLICIGIHLGFNYNAIFKIIINNKTISYILGLIITIFGIYSWIHLNIWNHLIGKYSFSIVTDNLIINILEYSSVSIMITIITNFIYKKLNMKGR